MWEAITRFSSLRSIEVDLLDACCPMGCCRSFYLNFALTMQYVTKARIAGSLNEEEMAQVYHWWVQSACFRSQEEIEEDYQTTYVVVGDK